MDANAQGVRLEDWLGAWHFFVLLPEPTSSIICVNES